jgi:hypothetical protein
VLAVGPAGRPRLPVVEAPGWLWYADAAAVVAAFKDTLDIAVLRLAGHHDDRANGLRDLVFSAALRDGAQPPADGRWVEPDAVLHEDSLTEGATESLTEGARRQPWASPAWLPVAEGWLGKALGEAGYRPVGRAEQVKVWNLSCVLRQPTDRGDVYLKANIDAPLFGNEAATVVVLSTLFPGLVPAPVVTHPGRGWFVTADFGKEIGWEAPLDVRLEVVREFARLQIASAPHVDRLMAAGCLDRRPAWLADQIPGWFAAANTAPWAGAEVAGRLQTAVPRLVELCGELDGLGLPATLAHGDMHMANVARGPGGGFVFFDWTDACVAHPFIDLIAVGHERDERDRARLRGAYLGEWDGLGNLDRAWAIAEVLAPVNQAISYMSLGHFLRQRHGGAPSLIFGSYTRHWLDAVLPAIDRVTRS